ncbi:Dolichyl-phosphate-mannose-protein mannosyltransferase-domain-containing protein [Gymnopilus junonius]|uniref:dolichyl-phosphate-mannose--protein mannosyltransferase n=1 Tax=Gymnopilus junonius TaxID=109634 RepID=A0A9P5TNI1_GYMJU|nr:Dolichyl-phosphate-mannose-protein mannosyltransferase-domain-containing protein [Gymnopilus junonius]
MLVGLAGLLAGYDGSFEFKSGEAYPESVPYVAMRVMLALFGVGMVPLGWYTSVELGMSRWACHLTALMVLLDVGWLCISRFILLDSMLLFFTFLTVFCLTKFHNQQYQSFSVDWWTWLFLTGTSIGAVTSVKMIGLFVTALIGVYTIEDLWEKFGDTKMTWREQAKHWGARVLCLIVVPILVFMLSFKIHFMVLNHSGPGDAQMSSLFQANLVGNDFAQNPLGKRLTLSSTPKHSHPSSPPLRNRVWIQNHTEKHGLGRRPAALARANIPGGSNQQQVTCYHYKDNNNEWTILPRWNELPYNPTSPELRYLKHGDTIILRHVPTTRNLHSHTVLAPVTKLNYEVSCYGNETIGDDHDHWRVEVVDDVKRGGKGGDVGRIHSLTTRLRLRHETLGCYLRASNAILPQWGFKQVEVSCDKEDNKGDEHTYWNEWCMFVFFNNSFVHFPFVVPRNTGVFVHCIQYFSCFRTVRVLVVSFLSSLSSRLCPRHSPFRPGCSRHQQFERKGSDDEVRKVFIFFCSPNPRNKHISKFCTRFKIMIVNKS